MNPHKHEQSGHHVLEYHASGIWACKFCGMLAHGGDWIDSVDGCPTEVFDDVLDKVQDELVSDLAELAA